MNCKEFEEAIEKYIIDTDSDISFAEKFEHHMLICDNCRQVYLNALQTIEDAKYLIRSESKDALAKDVEVDTQTFKSFKNIASSDSLLKTNYEFVKTVADKIMKEEQKLAIPERLTFIIDGVEKIVELINDQVVIPVRGLQKLIVKDEKQNLFEKRFVKQFSLGFEDGESSKTLYEDKNMIIKFEKGIYQDKLIIDSKIR